MRNAYEIYGTSAFIHLVRDNGEVLRAVVDQEDIAVLRKFPYKWSASWSPTSLTFYAIGSAPENSETKVKLHRFLLNAPEHMVVDHKDHDGLNNRRGNLRVVTNQENLMNRRIVYPEPLAPGGSEGLPAPPGFKYRYVSWDQAVRRWQARIPVNGGPARMRIGYFLDPIDAARAVASAMGWPPPETIHTGVSL